MAEASRLQIVDSLKSYLTSGEYSNLTTKCGDDVYNIHKMIVCTRAGFFARAIKFGGRKAQENVIDLPDDEPRVIAALIQYMYTDAYNSDLSGIPEAQHATPLNASNMIIDCTEIPHAVLNHDYIYEFPHTCAKQPCVKWLLRPHHICTVNCHSTRRAFICKTCCSVRGSPDTLLNLSKIYAITDKYDVTGLRELVCKDFALACDAFWDEDTFAIAIDHVFSSTVPEDTGLRHIVIETISKHMAVVKKPEIQALVTKHGDLALGVLLKKIG